MPVPIITVRLPEHCIRIAVKIESKCLPSLCQNIIRPTFDIIILDQKVLIYKLLTIILQVTSAFLLINVEFPFEDDVMAKLRDIYEIVDVYRVQGMYDIIAKVELDKEEELKELVSERIRKVDRITGTVTIMIAQGKVEGGGN